MAEPRIIDVTKQRERMDDMRALFREYATEIGIDLAFQDFEDELAGLPGRYAAPRGCILLAELDGDAVGCIALRPLEGDVGEIKRMYIKPAARGHGLAGRLARECIRQAIECGYKRLRLDTLKSMLPARKLYGRLGFIEIEPYYHNPLPDVVYYELVLQNGPNREEPRRAAK